MVSQAKTLVRHLFARCGFQIRAVGSPDSVRGLDLIHDARAILGDRSPVVLFDVGANVGQTIDQFRGAFVRGRIFAFEPSPATFQALRRKYGGIADVRLENVAFGDQEGTFPLHVTSDPVNDSLLRPVWIDEAQTVPVRVETLDGYCARNAVGEIDLLKIDTQGYDLHVLRGARDLLGRHRVRLFCVEINFCPMYDGQADLLGLLSFADPLGYRPVGFYEITYARNRPWFMNALFEYAGA